MYLRTSARVLLCLAFTAVTGNAGFADSQEPMPERTRLTRLSLDELGNTEVTTVSKEPVKLNRTPAAIYVITQEDIQRSGATSIPEVLRLAPGVEVSRIDSDKWSLGVRGFESHLSRSVLVLIDGRSVYTPLYAGVYWEVQDTLLEDVERIEVIRGPGGTIWGANAVNAVINIITKSSKDTHGALVSTGGGSVDQGLGGVRYGGGNGKNSNYRLYGKGFIRGSEFHPTQSRFDDWRMGQGGFRTDWDLDTRDTLTLQGDLYSGKAGERVTVTTYSPPAATNVNQPAYLSGGNLVGRWRRVLDQGSDFQLQAYFDRTDRQEPTLGETRDTFDIDFLHHLTSLKRQSFLWGLGARVSPSHFRQVVPTLTLEPHETDQIYSLFAQDEIALVSDRLWLTIGSKLMHNNYTGFEVQPTARLLWALSSRQSVWTAVTRAVRTPSRVEEDLQGAVLVSPQPPTFFYVTGGGHFSSERLIGYEGGYRRVLGSKLYLDVAAFYNDYNHLLSLEPGTPSFVTSPAPPHTVIPVFLRNGILGTTSGIEIAPDWRPSPWWRLVGSYSYLNMELRHSPSSLDVSTAPSTEGSSPAHEGSIQSRFDLPKRFEFDQTYRYVSSLSAQQLRAYGTADVQFAWRWSGFELSVVGQNLLQPRHFEYGGDPGGLVGIKRSIYGKITWRSVVD